VNARITSGCSKRLFSKAAASEEAKRTLRYVEPLSDARTPLANVFGILLGLPRSFRLDRYSEKDCAASAIHEDFDPISNMSRSIDSSIFVMRRAIFDTTDFLKHIRSTLDRPSLVTPLLFH
jgi:hypothetical protein